jgi:hypothetical protein
MPGAQHRHGECQKGNIMKMDLLDPVVWGSIGSIVICVIIVVYLGFKIKALIAKDAEAHKK